ncbi:hypothetical protein [uncultured Dysosmobacter sp.]|nr:hypothetical protein [uncultured Dysosmobacter sp.]
MTRLAEEPGERKERAARAAALLQEAASRRKIDLKLWKRPGKRSK